MKSVALVAVLLALATSHGGVVPPRGYRLPVEADYIDYWQTFRKELPEPFVARADFNSDGLADEAWLLPRLSGGFGLFAFMGAADAAPRVARLAGASDLSVQGWGIEVVTPGRYRTACGKGYWACEPGEPEVLVLTAPAVSFTKFESASSIFWWNAKAGRFTRTWISD